MEIGIDMARLLMLTGSLFLLPAGYEQLHLSPFFDPECTQDCSWPYLEDGTPERQFCEMIPGSQDGLTEICHNPFRPPKDVNDRPGPPENVQVLDYSKIVNSSDQSQQYTCINITYNLVKYSAHNVKGLQLALRGMSIEDLNKYYCINLNFSKTGLNYFAVLDENESQAKLSFSCFCGLKPGRRYTVSIRTMPVDIIGTSPHETIKQITYTPPGCNDQKKINDVRCRRSPEALWQPQCVSIKQNTSSPGHQGDYDILEVSFEVAPVSFLFDFYDIHVYASRKLVDSKRIDMKTASTMNQTCSAGHSTSVQFVTARFDAGHSYRKTRWLPSTEFYVAIQPDPNYNNCKYIDGHSVECKRTFSNKFSLIEDPCKGNPCTPYGQCISEEERYSCVCQPGYMVWNGACKEDPCQHGANSTSSCVNGECIYTRGRNDYYCHCNLNYLNVGKTCLADPCSKDPESNTTICGLHAQCNQTFHNDSVSHSCVCNSGNRAQDNTCEEDIKLVWIIVMTVGSCLTGLLPFIICFIKKIGPFSGPKRSDTRRHQPIVLTPDFAPTPYIQVNPEHVLRTKRVLPIFSEDHEKHKDVVVKFCRLLQRHCKCEVSLLDWCTPIGPTVEMWLTTEIEKADIVLLLCSKGTRLKYEAKANRALIPTDSDSEYGDVFVKALTLLDNYFGQNNADEKFVVAYFDYSSKDDVPVTFRRFATYRLMHSMECLYLRIHNKVKDSPCSSRRVPALDRYYELDVGISLQNAIEEMKDVIRTDRLWYQNYNRSSSPLRYFSDPFESTSSQLPRAPSEFFNNSSSGRDSGGDFEDLLAEFQNMSSDPQEEALAADLELQPLYQVHPGGAYVEQTDLDEQNADSGMGGMSFEESSDFQV